MVSYVIWIEILSLSLTDRLRPIMSCFVYIKHSWGNICTVIWVEMSDVFINYIFTFKNMVLTFNLVWSYAWLGNMEYLYQLFTLSSYIFLSASPGRFKVTPRECYLFTCEVREPSSYHSFCLCSHYLVLLLWLLG